MSKFQSRKLYFCAATSVAVLGAGALAAFVPGFRSGLDVVVGGLLASAGLYLGGNVSAKWANGKVSTSPVKAKAKPKAPKAPEGD